MGSEVWSITWFSLVIALASTVVILPFGTALAWWLARHAWRGRALVETLVSLPLVMPPVATGLILLKLLGRRSWLGAGFARIFGDDIVFSWRAVLVATAVMSFPLLVRSARIAFEGVPVRLEQVARTLGAGPWRMFFTVTLPLAGRGVTAGAVLAFARALGEFGATIMVAGYIPGKTATLSLSIYHWVELGRDGDALRLLAISVALAFGSVLLSEYFLRRPAA
jgi:molybdate transport system permease protein